MHANFHVSRPYHFGATFDTKSLKKIKKIKKNKQYENNMTPALLSGGHN